MFQLFMSEEIVIRSNLLLIYFWYQVTKVSCITLKSPNCCMLLVDTPVSFRVTFVINRLIFSSNRTDRMVVVRDVYGCSHRQYFYVLCCLNVIDTAREVEKMTKIKGPVVYGTDCPWFWGSMIDTQNTPLGMF